MAFMRVMALGLSLWPLLSFRFAIMFPWDTLSGECKVLFLVDLILIQCWPVFISVLNNRRRPKVISRRATPLAVNGFAKT